MTTRILRRAAAFAAALLLAVAAPHARVAAQTRDLPVLTQPVNDFANVIDPASAAAMDRMIRALQAATGDAVVVASVKTFAPYGSIEEYGVKLFERAGIGEKGKDNGLLILVAVDDRRARIEVGYGLEGFITDGFCGDVIRSAMLPAFRRNAYGEGLADATTRVISRIAKERNVTLTDLPAPARPEPRDADGGGIVQLIVIVLVILFILGRGGRGGGLLGFLLGQAIANAGRRSRGGWSGWNGGFGGGMGGGFGGGGGGFGGFGGGRSGGGGASGGW